MAGFFLHPVDLRRLRITRQHGFKLCLRERIHLLYANDGDIGNIAGVTPSDDVVIYLARTEQNSLDGLRLYTRVVENFVESA